jgi:hypothetical protein
MTDELTSDSGTSMTNVIMFAAETLLVIAALLRWARHLRRLRPGG